MGDVLDEIGDIYEGGDADDFGAYGDVSTAALDTFQTLIGDTDDYEQGALRLPHINIPKFRNWSTGAKIGAGVVGAGAAAFGVEELVKALKRRHQRRLAVRATQNSNAANATIANQVRARRLLGKIPKETPMPFYQMAGASLNSYPLAPTEFFIADTLKYNLNRQSTDTPFEVEIQPGVFAGVTWTLTATGVPGIRYYTCVIITIGINVFTGNPGTIFNITGTFPTINGSLVVSTNPFSFTIREKFYARFIIFPWQLVTNKPLLALGAYNNAAPITVAITGLPSAAQTNIIVPGSQHIWAIGMRNQLL
jgi:hypothetical protein